MVNVADYSQSNLGKIEIAPKYYLLSHPLRHQK